MTMNGIKILVSPLSWGFGHAGRMIPLAKELSQRGFSVFFAADKPLLRMVEKELPGITTLEIPGFNIRYSRFVPQYLCIFIQLPKIFISAVRDRRILKRIAKQIMPSVIISDNRFGFFHRDIFSVYVTHQVIIPFPAPLKFMESLAGWIHRMIISRYDLCLVPDFPGDVNLSGRLSHGDKRLPANLIYTGPLSRFAIPDAAPAGDLQLPPAPYVCLILSGPEPQRTLLLEKVLAALPASNLAVLSALPVARPDQTGITTKYIISADTPAMRRVITGASLVIARAGYTSVMELASLRKDALLIPTPGQPEQEYLAGYLNGRFGFTTARQERQDRLALLIQSLCKQSATIAGEKKSACQKLPDPSPLLEKAIALLAEQEKKRNTHRHHPRNQPRPGL